MINDRIGPVISDEAMHAETLILRSRGGDGEAFNELIRSYWRKVYNWAFIYTQEQHLAEDVVQETFTKVYLHLDSLQDSKLFFPWLKRIMRNTAFTKIKKHSSHTELSLSSINDASSKTTGNNERRPAGCDRSLSIEDQVILKDEYIAVRMMLNCLSKRERQVFESHFFHDMTANEVAAKFGITNSNVYTILSRAKDKIYKQTVIASVKKYILKIKEHDRMDKIFLEKPENFLFQSWTTISNCVHLLSKYAAKNYSFTEVFGLTGQSFRLNLVGDEINIGGPTSYNWQDIFHEGLSALGLRCKTQFTPAAPNQDVNYQLVNSFTKSVEAMEERPLQENLWEALDTIRASIKKGIPVITWDVFIPEFGIIYGFDDYTRCLHVIDHAKPDGAVLPYEHLGRGLLKDLFIMTAENTYSIDRLSSLKTALSLILRHAKGEEYNADLKVVSGIPAYSHWIRAFEKREIEPTGNSYCIHVVSDARKNASTFLEEVSGWSEADLDIESREIAKKASDKYQAAAKHLEVIREKFPFPEGGMPNEPEVSSFTIEQLNLVKRAEEEGIRLLEQLLLRISSRS